VPRRQEERLSFPVESKYRAARQLELVHADLCGPITPPTVGGKKMFLLIVDFFRYWISNPTSTSRDVQSQKLQKERKKRKATVL
jgi:hypothetical protein